MMSSFCTHQGLPHTNHDVIILHPLRFTTHKSGCHHSAPTEVYHTQIMMSSFCKQHLCLSPSDSDLLNEVSGTFTFYHFTTSLHEIQVASLAPLPVPGSSSHKSSATQCYLCMWCYSVYLSLAPAATRAVLPSATCVCGVTVFTCPWLQQPQEQCYPMLPVYVVFQCLPVPGSSSHKSRATQCYLCMWCFSFYLSLAPAATRAVLPVYVVSYPVLPVYVVSYPVLPVYVVSYPVLPVYVVSYPVLPVYVMSYAVLPIYVVSYPVLPLVRCASQDWTGVATQSNLVLQTQNILNASGV